MFPNFISRLLDQKCVSKKSSIFKLDPFLGDNEIIRVGGRISQANMEYKLRHAILLPKMVILHRPSSIFITGKLDIVAEK